MSKIELGIVSKGVVGPDGYEYICMHSDNGTNTAGCCQRWGRRIMGPRSVAFKLCPPCDAKFQKIKSLKRVVH